MPAYTLNRNHAMGKFFEMIKKRKIAFPKYDDFSSFVDDILNVQLEYDEQRGVTKYINIGPDDFVHATVFALVSAEMAFGAKFMN